MIKLKLGYYLMIVDNDQVDQDLVADCKPINTDASIDLCIELGSGDIIYIDEYTNILLTIDIDPFLVLILISTRTHDIIIVMVNFYIKLNDLFFNTFHEF
jgi:hypothetical protein